jgi:hypothetical protein
MCNTDEFRKQIFGDKTYNKYTYVPLVRFPEEEEEDEVKVDKNGNPYYRPPYSKFKIDLEYSSDPDNQTNKPMLALFERVDGKREKIEMNTFEDMLDYVKYRNKLKFIISFSKLYAMKTSNGGEKKKYGITLKINCIEVTQNQQMKSKVDNNRDIFDDSDDEVEQKVNTITRNTNKLDIDNDEEDSDDTANIKQISAKTKSISKKAKDESDEESEEEVKVVQKSKSKKVVESDDDDGSEEVIEEPKKAVKKPIAKRK